MIAPKDVIAGAEQEWRALVAEHLPHAAPESIWRFNRPSSSQADGTQGWKLHVSATSRSAADVLRRVAPVLAEMSVLWKAPGSMVDIRRLNSGLFYGYTQIGKVITAYAGDADRARSLAGRLDVELRGVPGPRVPFDRRLRPGSVVHYRYGAFHPVSQVEVDGVQVDALVTPDGQLQPDRRAEAVPGWVEDLFPAAPPEPPRGPLARTYLAYESIAQRGKGGTYRALDLRSSPAERVVLKEGRRHGETDFDGRDGRDRVAHEARVLAELSAAGAPVPVLLDSFAWEENHYIVMEHLDGPGLLELPGERERVGAAAGVAEVVAGIHAAGWAWRDCKVTNLIAAPDGVRAIDLEGACPISDPDPWPWGSPGHVPPEWPFTTLVVEQDLYALGAVLRQLLDGIAAPAEVSRLVTALLADDPAERPPAAAVHEALSRFHGRPHVRSCSRVRA
ncbi:class III lanthionine synthetase LanKC N-terminal domain-containing protein [Nonomuraea helvata]|uniref:Protein kinase domain-containing protein n=1 Tax=Nonomuraea helvata TaxID=37484 RepID=A0ABV5S5P8_9ACTN